MDTTKELSVGKDQNITFKKWFHYETKLPTGEWFASISIKGLDIEYSFYETIFKKCNSDEIIIDWKVVRQIANTVLENIDSLIRKSETLLIALHKEIFGNEYEEKQGYFEFSAIKIRRILDVWSEFDLIFWLDSRSDPNYLMDPYYSYHVSFNQRPTLIGVRRQG